MAPSDLPDRDPPEDERDSSTEPPAEAQAAAEDLPEWEPLSPELLEDEAIRGDFVLRWMIVVLALLIGCREIRDARTLVHVRSGEYLAAHGVLPPATDPFSFTASDRRWINLSWLFDLVTAGVHAVTGSIGLSLLQGLVAAGTLFLVLSASHATIRTWWSAICAALLVFAVYPQWDWRPELVTLLGTAALLWWLVPQEEQDQPDRRSFLAIVLGLWCWSQFDPRAWLGLLLLVLFAAGQSLSRRATLGSYGWWPVTGVAALALLVHPFLWETWLAPLRQYAVEYPALRLAYPRPASIDTAWYSLLSPVVWSRVNHRLIAGLILMVAALATLLLNVRRASATYWLWWLGGNLLAVLTLHELPFAAVINCVVASVQAQDWYKARFGQIYQVVWTEILFSRVGRAVTLCSFFIAMWLVVSGRLTGPDGYRTGLGLSRGLAQELEDFQSLGEFTPDDHGFHLTLRQGDALIAAGRRSFVDHRVGIFSGQAPDLIALHFDARELTHPLSTVVTLAEQSGLREAAFDKYAVSHVLPRLNRELAAPDYTTCRELLESDAWLLVQVLPSCSVFVRQSATDPEIVEFAQSHALNALNLSFRSEESPDVEPHERVSPPAWSQQLLSLPRESQAGGTQLASHWLRLQRDLPTAPLPFQLSASLIEIRAAQEGVQETPKLAAAYRTLGAAYAYLLRIESAILAENGINWGQSLRYYQAVGALRQADQLEPDDPETLMQLAELWQGAGKADVTYEALERFLNATATAEPRNEADTAMRESLETLRGRLMQVVADNNARIDDGLSKQADRLQLALASHQAGCLNRAIELLQEDAIYVERNPLARLQLTVWLAERGDGVDLDDSALALEGVAGSLSVANWRDPVAYAALGRADYQFAVDTWKQAARELENSRATSLLVTLPMATSSPFFLGDAQYPLSHLLAVQDAAQRQAYAISVTEWQRAMCELERGNREGAQQDLRRALDTAPNSPWRPLLRLYWYCLTDELLDAEPPHDWIPQPGDLFAEEPAQP